ncbi:MAG: protein kinase [Candidatus Brocadiaceae bacterium]|nr:protein kinase [Candidatus Brocadiaceae bacterium]
MSAARITEHGCLGRYALLEHLGKGGMAVVYRATDTDTGAVVAVKIFQSGPARAPEVSAQLRDREVRMLQSVQHPNIVKYRDSGEEDDTYFFAMEYVEDSLLTCMRRGTPFELVDRVLLLRQTASALAAVHQQGIVHRDVKPGNILLDHDPNHTLHAKLTDLGIAKNVSETDIVREHMPTRVPGTPKYLAPEQIRLQAVDGRADIFSLGVVAYELLTGTLPFHAEDSDGFLKANVGQQQTPAAQVDSRLPAFLSDMVDRMLAKDREQRYDAETLARDLELAQQHLVSGAPLNERTNTASMFYHPRVRTPRPPPSPAPHPALPHAAVAAACALVGLLACIVLWPRVGDAPRAGDAPPSPALTNLLHEARNAVPEGARWRALASVRALAGRDMHPETAAEVLRIEQEVQDELAEPFRAAVARMLAENRVAEARIAVRRMQDILPRARATAPLVRALDRRLALPPDEDAWQEALRETHALVRSRRYPSALDARKALLADAGDDPERLEAARRSIADVFEHWGHYLLTTYPQAEEIDDFFRTLDANVAVLESPPARVLGELRMRLARIYRDRGRYRDALAQYQAAVDAGTPDVVQEAERARAELVAWLADRPQDPAEFAAGLHREGFGGDAWTDHAEGGAVRQAADGVLVLEVQAGRGQRTARRETVRPLRTLGFACRVEFRASPEVVAEAGGARLGLAVVSQGKDSFELAFDGRAYGASVRRRSGGAALGTTLRGAIGDEDHLWHALVLDYDYDTGRLIVRLDEQELRRYSLDLGDLRLCVFLEAAPGGAAAASFRNLSFDPHSVPRSP